MSLPEVNTIRHRIQTTPKKEARYCLMSAARTREGTKEWR